MSLELKKCTNCQERIKTSLECCPYCGGTKFFGKREMDNTLHTNRENMKTEINSQLEMYCKNCGQKLNTGAKFCGSCGQKVIEINANDKHELKSLLAYCKNIIFAGIIAMILLIIYIKTYPNNNSKSKIDNSVKANNDASDIQKIESDIGISARDILKDYVNEFMIDYGGPKVIVLSNKKRPAFKIILRGTFNANFKKVTEIDLIEIRYPGNDNADGIDTLLLKEELFWAVTVLTNLFPEYTETNNEITEWLVNFYDKSTPGEKTSKKKRNIEIFLRHKTSTFSLDSLVIGVEITHQ